MTSASLECVRSTTRVTPHDTEIMLLARMGDAVHETESAKEARVATCETGTQGAYVSIHTPMATLIRVALWTAVLIAPGGILLAPVLVAREVERRKRAVP
jgi:hypothetical protein